MLKKILYVFKNPLKKGDIQGNDELQQKKYVSIQQLLRKVTNRGKAFFLKFLSGILLTMFLAGNILAAEIPAKPLNFVTDLAEILSPSEENDLNLHIQTIEKDTTAEIAILTITSLKDQKYSVIEDFAYEVFNSWQIGKKDVDNGILIVIAVNDHKFRIETGSGTEGAVVDNNARHIAEKHFVPNFQSGKYFAGLYGAVDDIAGLIKQDPLLVSEYQKKTANDSKLSDIALYVIILIIFFGPSAVLAWYKKIFKTDKKTRLAGIISSVLLFGLGIFIIFTGMFVAISMLLFFFGIVMFLASIFGGFGGTGHSGGGPFIMWGGGSGFGSGGFGGGFGGFGGGGSSGGGFSGGW